MARGSSFLNTTMKIAKAIDADRRRSANNAIRQHNAEVRHYNAEVRQAQRQQKEYEKLQNQLSKQAEKARILNQKEQAIQYALDKTNEAEAFRTALTSIATQASDFPLPFSWEQLKILDEFSEPQPKKPKYLDTPKEINNEEYKINFTFIDKIFKKNMERKIKEASAALELAMYKYSQDVKCVNETNNKMKEEYEKLYNSWKATENEFYENKKEHNAKIDLYEKDFLENQHDAVELYFDSILNLVDITSAVSSSCSSNYLYPQSMTANLHIDLLTSWALNYDPISKILIIDYDLPDRDIIPKIKTIKYVTTRNEFTETYLKDKEIDQIYEEMLLQLPLRITNDLYFSDINAQLESIVFNGFLTSINKSTGNEETKCIMSLQTNKNEFMKINIKHVDAKARFLKFKGISGSKLSELIPVAPILQFNKDDSRFVDSKALSGVINGTNLASMHWEDFEHLIREVFEKEFATNGSEIKITQASRDGGVDAVMFDPDPIRGGKYIIQAKRYTNIVGISAVRDLYGTLMNEGAVKGILVTTSNYGADSYEFAKDKPISLINGSNLLHMLQKHGYNAKIDIDEARKTLMDK